MSGPCLCGDPYCNSCFPGNDGGALEAAEEAMMERLAKEQVSAPELGLILEAGLVAIREHRKLADSRVAEAVGEERMAQEAKVASGFTDEENRKTRVRLYDTEIIVEDLAMLVRRLIRRLPGTDEVARKAADYLQRKNLLGSPLREVEG